jgi:membrane carboxypeptidase/penicillin-binding protein
MAARSYFKKPASALNLTEGAMLAAMAKGPAYFSPDRYPERARQRFIYVLKRMQEDKVDNADEGSAQPRIVPYEKPRRESGVHFLDHLLREARTLVGMQSLTVESYAVRSTINLKLQRAAEAALQEGLARYEARSHRIEFTGPEVNLGESVYRFETDMRTKAQRRGRAKPVWQIALQNARLPLYDVQWPAAIVIERRPNERGQLGVKVGLKDGRTLPLTTPEGVEIGKLKLNDVVYVRVTEGKTRNDAKAELRVRPKVQGAAVVLENKTGRILAMVGGFSYPASQLNRATQALRQPGSSIKPVVYLAALHKGLQPNTLVQDSGVTLPPIPGVSNHSWSPKNYDGGGSGVMTMRRALEQSKNMVTARLLDGGVDKDPKRSLELVCNLALEARIYSECMKNYPFVLGAQALRMINLAGFYASIASEGQRVTPYAIDSIEQDGKPVYRHVVAKPVYLAEGDRTAFYQLRTMLEGTVARGTAASIRQHAGFVGGKTGTTDSENDAWFVGFTSDVTVAVWMGYDNAGAKRTLGTGETGGKNAVPIAEQIIQATWQYHAPKTPLAPPSAEIARNLKAMPIDVFTGQKAASSKTAFMEYFRVTGGKIRETQHAMVGRGHVVQVPRSASFDDERPLYANPRMAAPYQRPPRTLRELFGLQRF